MAAPARQAEGRRAKPGVGESRGSAASQQPSVVRRATASTLRAVEGLAARRECGGKPFHASSACCKQGGRHPDRGQRQPIRGYGNRPPEGGARQGHQAEAPRRGFAAEFRGGRAPAARMRRRDNLLAVRPYSDLQGVPSPSTRPARAGPKDPNWLQRIGQICCSWRFLTRRRRTSSTSTATSPDRAVGGGSTRFAERGTSA